MAAAAHRCVAVRTSATRRSSGCFPPAGTPNAAASSSLSSSSAVVPSNAVTSIPCHSCPMPSSASVRAASSSNALRATCSPDRIRAFDSAGPVGTGVPGATGSRPGIANTVRRTWS